MSDATRRLDGVTSLVALDALNPSDYAAALATEPATADSRAEIEALDARFAAALRALDDFAARAMKLRLDAALATDTSIGAPTRKVFATTIAGYAGKLDLLAERVRSVAERGGAADPAAVTARVVDAARTTLAQRDAMAEPVLALIAERAGALVALADGRARDKRTDVALRKQWSALRRELEAVHAQPARVLAPFAARLAEHDEQIDEPIEPEVNVADLIELD